MKFVQVGYSPWYELFVQFAGQRTRVAMIHHNPRWIWPYEATMNIGRAIKVRGRTLKECRAEAEKVTRDTLIQMGQEAGSHV